MNGCAYEVHRLNLSSSILDESNANSKGTRGSLKRNDKEKRFSLARKLVREAHMRIQKKKRGCVVTCWWHGVGFRKGTCISVVHGN